MNKNEISKDVEVMAICTKCLISAMGMQAENLNRVHGNQSPAYDEEQFEKLVSEINAVIKSNS